MIGPDPNSTPAPAGTPLVGTARADHAPATALVLAGETPGGGLGRAAATQGWPVLIGTGVGTLMRRLFFTPASVVIVEIDGPGDSHLGLVRKVRPHRPEARFAASLAPADGCLAEGVEQQARVAGCIWWFAPGTCAASFIQAADLLAASEPAHLHEAFHGVSGIPPPSQQPIRPPPATADRGPPRHGHARPPGLEKSP